jgi:hypothetical protein
MKVVITNITAIIVARGFISTITTMHPMAPAREKIQDTLNVGLNEGFFRKFSIAHEILRTP